MTEGGQKSLTLDTAIRALHWMGAEDALTRVLEALDGRDLFEAISHGVDPNLLSEAARARLGGTLQLRVDEADGPAERVRTLVRLAQFGHSDAVDQLKDHLEGVTEGELRSADDSLLASALKAVRAVDATWANAWIAVRIAEGVLWAERWIPRLDAVPREIVEQTVARIGGEEADHRHLQGATALIAKAADLELAKKIWQRLFELNAPVDGNPESQPERSRAVLRHQMEELARGLPPSLRVSGAIETHSAPPTLGELRAVLEVFGRAAEEDDLHSELPAQIRQSLHDVLARAVPSVLEQEDFSGSLKASLALALARVGGPGTASQVRGLVRADIERCRSGLEAFAQGDRGPRANGALMRWSNWYVRALRWLGADVAEPILLELLAEPEYKDDAAGALASLALPDPKPRLGLWMPERLAGPDAGQPPVIDEVRRARYAAALAARVSAHLTALEQSESPGQVPGRIKALACTLARLDGRNSLALVLQAMALPGTWDGWKRVDALDELLRQHSRIPTETTLAILDPTIDHTISQGLYNEQNAYLLKRCLCVLPFVTDPARGINRIREILSTTRFGGYNLRELVGALARSGSEEALEFLIELASSRNFGFQSFAREWIIALGAIDLPRARAILMGFIDPSVTTSIAISPDLHEAVAAQVVTAAEKDAEIRIRVRQICDVDLSPAQRQIVAAVVAMSVDADTVLAGLNLVRDDATPPIPFHLIRAIECVAFERRPYGASASTYSLIPRSGAALRERLFAMLLNDSFRRWSAFSLLGQIEDWRLDYGRPPVEPRHPLIGSGSPWPPLKEMGL